MEGSILIYVPILPENLHKSVADLCAIFAERIRSDIVVELLGGVQHVNRSHFLIGATPLEVQATCSYSH